ARRAILSLPTRRSSDLWYRAVTGAATWRRGVHAARNLRYCRTWRLRENIARAALTHAARRRPHHQDPAAAASREVLAWHDPARGSQPGWVRHWTTAGSAAHRWLLRVHLHRQRQRNVHRRRA